MTTTDIISEVRSLLNDTSSTRQRYSTTELVGYLSDGQKLLVARRRDSMVNPSLDPPVSLSDGDTLAVRDEFKPALVFYTAGRAMLRDTEDAGSVGLGKAYIENFEYHVNAL